MTSITSPEQINGDGLCPLTMCLYGYALLSALLLSFPVRGQKKPLTDMQ